MAECELTKTCIFFNDQMGGMPSTAEMMKQRFCQGDYQECARYMIVKALGREKVPPTLFPNQADRAREIIAGR